jgi:hypothetical protein
MSNKNLIFFERHPIKQVLHYRFYIKNLIKRLKSPHFKRYFKLFNKKKVSDKSSVYQTGYISPKNESDLNRLPSFSVCPPTNSVWKRVK